MRGIVKRFPGVLALGGVELEVRAGEVHCLLGQNGAGKSTLIKILSASYQPDEGEILWEGEPVSLSTPQTAMDLGISTIYQELDLVPDLSVAENIFLGHELSDGRLQPARARRSAARATCSPGSGTPRSRPPARSAGSRPPRSRSSAWRAPSPRTPGCSSSTSRPPSSTRARSTTSSASSATSRPRASPSSTSRTGSRRSAQIGDRITVLKDGSTVATGLAVDQTPTSELIKLMTGRSIEYVFPPRGDAAAATGDPSSRSTGLELPGVFTGVDLSVRAGEIVGLAGLVGAGRSEILETLYGARRPSAGTVRVAGKELRRGSVPAAVKAGVGLAPEERKSQGLLLDQAIYANITVSTMGRFSRFGLLDGRAERKRSAEVAESLDVRPAGVDRLVRLLSGGNQQKVVLARWLLRGCRVLLLDEPTRGVDVGARAEIYALVRSLADSGVAVVVVSSEVEEVLGLADRVLVVREGRVVHEGPAGEIDESRVLDLVMEGKVA